MIHCKPKLSTYISLAMVAALLVIGLIYLLHDFTYNKSFSLLVYIISCSLLTVVLLIILVKMMAGYRFVSVGKGKIEVRVPLKALKKTYGLEQVKAWQEETILANKRDFRQLTIVFDDRNSISLSNHEHTSYMELLKYLQGKLIKKKVK